MLRLPSAAAMRRLPFTGSVVAIALCLVGCTSPQDHATPSHLSEGTGSLEEASPAPTTRPVMGPTTQVSVETSDTKQPATRATRSEAPPPTTPVAPPSSGNIHQAIATQHVSTLSSAPLTGQVSPHHGVIISVTKIQALRTEAHFPGEIAGPGIAITVAVANSSTHTINLDNTIVDVRGSDDRRAIQVSGDPAAPVTGALKPGEHTSGVYVFTIPLDKRHPISIRISYAAKTPTVLFVGEAN